MNERIKVLYDVSCLGDIHCPKNIRTGIFRVNEEMLYALKASGQCDISYSADYASWNYASGFFFQNPNMKSSEGLCENKWLRIFNRPFEILAKIRIKGVQHISEMGLGILENYFLLDPNVLRKADIFHIAAYSPLPTQIKRAKHLKKFFFVHDLIPILYPHFFELKDTAWLMYHLEEARKDGWFLCNSYYTKKDLCNYFPALDPARIFVLHLGASDSFFLCQDKDKRTIVLKKYGIHDKPYILSVCTFDHRKNLVHLIKCFKELVRHEGLVDLRLVLVGVQGRASDDILNETEGKMNDRIIVTGFVDDEHLAPLYSGALMFVTPSLCEGFSLPTLEAMKCGVPVITSNTSAFPEVVGDAGIMIDPTDKDALKAGILNLYRDPSLREILSKKGLERSRQFTWEKCAQELVDAYRSVLRR